MKLSWVFLTLLTFASSPQAASGPEVPGTGLPCSDSVRRVIGQWEPEPAWMKRPGPDTDTQVFRTPTARIGEWLELRGVPNRSVSALRITPRTTVRVEWGVPSCEPRLETYARSYDERRMRASFTDSDLEALLRAGRGGVIYVWSPQMPYSIDGLAQIRQAARALGIPVTTVSDPRVEPGRTIGSKPLASFELQARGVTDHYPSIVIYSNRKIRSVVPGLKSAETYARLIRDRLAPAKPASGGGP